MPTERRLLAILVAACSALALAGSAGASLTQLEAQILAQVNGARAAHGLRPLRADPRLMLAASAHTNEMMGSGSFSHGSFNTRMRAFGVRGPVFGEDLEWLDASQSGSVVADWLASPPHRANLLRPGFRRIGIGVTVGAFDGYSRVLMVTADFAGR